jgi:hypothetical protein
MEPIISDARIYQTTKSGGKAKATLDLVMLAMG